MSITIRQANPSDAEIIVTFNQRLARETENKTLNADVLRRGVAALLADAIKGVYYLAEENDDVLGQLMITREWSDWRNGWMWWIQSVYVHEKARRRGIFRRLFAHVRQLVENDSEGVGLRLYVESDNASAQSTYRDLGMAETSYRLMEQSPL